MSCYPMVDGEKVFLVDYIKPEKWLQTGAHVEPNEDSTQTTRRECREELELEGEFLLETPLLMTSTKTVGKTAGHIDISL